MHSWASELNKVWCLEELPQQMHDAEGQEVHQANLPERKSMYTHGEATCGIRIIRVQDHQ